MDLAEAETALQAVLGRSSDFVGGIDNEALDFSQLEDFINDENDASNTYFADTLAHNEAPRGPHATAVSMTAMTATATTPGGGGGLATMTAAPGGGGVGGSSIIVVVQDLPPGGSPAHHAAAKPGGLQPQQNYAHPHNLPESPPDSGSEPPYSPQDTAASHSPHQKSSGGHPELLLNPLPLMHHSTHLPLYPPSHLKPVLVQGADTLLGHQPVLTPLLTQRAAIDLAAQCHQQSLGLVSGGASSLALAAVHAGITAAECQPQPPPPAGGGNNSNGGITTVYASLQGGAKKRKLSQDGGQAIHVKQEPELSPDSSSNQTGALDDDYFDVQGESGLYLDSSYQCIRFQPFQQTSWHTLCDHNLKELPTPHYRVDADKGFNFSNADDAFVCQKKNHFQITCHAQLQGDAQFVKTPDGLLKVASFHLHFYGVKVESPTQTIKVEQSQSDRSKKPFHPVLCPHVSRVDLAGEQVTKVTVGRLHFSETTSNNMRKKGKPNPDQRYFYLVVGLHAHCADASHYPVVSHASERIIVRASNPGQFESDVELCWQKGHTPESIFHAGRVGINTDRPDEAMVIHGNLKVTGHIVQPSDSRAKSDVRECDSRAQLRNVAQLRVVQYRYVPEFAAHAGLASRDGDANGGGADGAERCGMAMDTGLIAQEVREVLPDAVRPAGDIVLPSGRRIDNFLVVNKDRIFMENVGAVKELCKVTDNLETRIDQLERMNRKLRRFDSGKSQGSYSTVSSKLSGASAKGGRCGVRYSSAKDGATLCSNKAIQITIFMLVMIMAFCLIAMATLYFVEVGRKNDKDFDNAAFSHRVAQSRSHQTHLRNNATDSNNGGNSSNNNGGGGGGVQAKRNNHRSNEINREGWYSRRPVAVKDAVTQGPPLSTPLEPIDAALSEEGEVLPPPAAPHSVPVVGRPGDCGGGGRAVAGGGKGDNTAQYLEVRQCQSYCCPSEAPRLDDSSEHPSDSAGRDANTVSRSSRQFGGGSVASSQEVSASNALDAAHRVATPDRKLNKSKKAVRRRRDSYEWISDNVYAGQDSAADADQTGLHLSVRGAAFNRTLGPEFCAPAAPDFERCAERTALNYSYAVPLSRYMPDDTVSLQFHFPRPSQWARPCPPEAGAAPAAAACPPGPRGPDNPAHPEWAEGGGSPHPTNATEASWEAVNAKDPHNSPTVARVDDSPAPAPASAVAGGRSLRGADGEWGAAGGGEGTAFSVEVGAVAAFALRYRVPLVQTVTNVCLLPTSKLGVEYLEYNFLFHRDCEE